MLAEQVAAALQRAEDYVQRLAYHRVQQELAFARQIQESFLPERLPELVARRVPARQTSGDFYDVIQLPDGRLGLVMADVADKGVGAALFSALSRTLIRTLCHELSRAAGAGAGRRQPRDQLFGEERLVRVLREQAAEPAMDTLEAVVTAVELFAGDAPQFDDLALLILKRK